MSSILDLIGQPHPLDGSGSYLTEEPTSGEATTSMDAGPDGRVLVGSA